MFFDRHPSDADLVRAVVQGQTQRFAALVERYQNLVYSTILGRTHRADEADDLAQEVFFQAFRHLTTLDDPRKFGPWVRRIAENQAVGFLRASMVRDQERPELVPLPLDRPDQVVERQDQQVAVWDAIARLPDDLREVILLHYMEECSVDRMAVLLDLSEAAVKGRLRRARAELKGDLERQVRAVVRGQRRSRVFTRKVMAGLPAPWLIATEGDAAVGLGGVLLKGLTVVTHYPVLVGCVVGSVLLHLLGLGVVVGIWPGSGEGSGIQIQLVSIPRRAPADLPAAPAPGYLAGQGAPWSASGSVAPSAQDLLQMNRSRSTPTRPDLAEMADLPAPTPLEPPSVPLSLASAIPGPAWAVSLPRGQADPTEPGRQPRRQPDRQPDQPVRVAHLAVGPNSVQGTGGNLALADLARHLRDYVGLTAQVADPNPGALRSGPVQATVLFVLDGYPLHPEAEESDQDRRPWTFAPEEMARLGDYLHGGGLLYVEGQGLWLREWVGLLRAVLGGEGRLYPLPFSHPLYRAFYTFERGFPGESDRLPAEVEAQDWSSSTRIPATTVTPSLWGIEQQGRLVALLNPVKLLGDWQPDTDGLTDDADSLQSSEPGAKLPALRAATNVVVYAMNQP
ncbi:MAG: sigma-70 family RNA polymerase sigma factor [Candidatus Latescibacterota bacterium]|jgi:RNA polymerase sigma factor (sigma-70 family)